MPASTGQGVAIACCSRAAGAVRTMASRMPNGGKTALRRDAKKGMGDMSAVQSPPTQRQGALA